MIDSLMFRALWKYRGFVLGSVRREFQERYRQSLLGKVWAVLNPLAMILIYTLVFAEVMKARMPGKETSLFAYSIYLCSGVLTWGLFVEMLGRLQTVFIANGNLLKKSSFPRICLPIIVTLSALVNFAIIFSLFLIFLLLTGNLPGGVLLAVLPVLLLQTLFALGLGVALGTLNVFFRDIGQFMGVLLQFWFWLTPIVYSPQMLSQGLRDIQQAYNPMAPIIQAYQHILLDQVAPDWGTLLPVTTITMALLFLAISLFRKLASEMVDEL